MRIGYFGIGIYRPKVGDNIGTMWRSAYIYDAKFTFTVNSRVAGPQAGDTVKTEHLLPYYHYDSLEEFINNLPEGAVLVGVEQAENSETLTDFKHPERAVYLMGAEDVGLPPDIQAYCDHIVEIPTPRGICHNVATAATLVLHDRHLKRGRPSQSP